ncbi:MAG: type II toxin-antitoxin system RelE/ParE family toxin [Chlorobi bacterium]|nr:type II toxin-antitoxin system RelE/ParE family toxin [Chlorobiota bacterium]
MSKYILTNKAVKDLSDIWNYTFDNWSERQADKYYKMLLDNCQMIAEKLYIGKNYENILNHLYGHKIGRHIIFYRIESEKEILIIRILHEQMDLKYRIKE